MNTLTVGWDAMKAVIALKKAKVQYGERDGAYEVVLVDGSLTFRCLLPKDGSSETEFETLYKPKANTSVEPRSMDGRVRYAVEKSDASKKNFFSHDWTDPTTWYTTAERVVGETPSAIVAGTSYQLAHTFVIDLSHGKVFAEDYFLDSAGNSYRVAVTVDGVSKTEVDPHTLAGDFTVDYSAGQISFSPSISTSASVQVTYHRMVDSTFVLKPDAGKVLKIDFAEVQFSGDVVISDSVIFQPYGVVDVFAPQLVPSVIPSGTLIPLGNPTVYKGMRDYQTEAVKAYPAVQAIGGSGWRGMQQPIMIFDWDYVSSTVIRSDAQMEVRLKLEHDAPFGGAFATCSFYCLSEDL